MLPVYTQLCERQKIDPARIKRALDVNFSAKYNYIYIYTRVYVVGFKGHIAVYA